MGSFFNVCVFDSSSATTATGSATGVEISARCTGSSEAALPLHAVHVNAATSRQVQFVKRIFVIFYIILMIKSSKRFVFG